MLSAELSDNAGWELLIELARTSGEDQLVERFTTAAEAEERHLAQVQTWVQDMVLNEVT
jgi:rubrerythrin